MIASDAYVIGVDYGSDSVRTIIADAHNGNEIAASVYYYPWWKDQLYCNAGDNQFRQHPLDYIEGLEDTIKRCLVQAGSYQEFTSYFFRALLQVINPVV